MVDLIDSLAQEALDAACLVIQKRLGVETGDAAGILFSDKVVLDNFKDYIRYELMLKESHA